MFYSAKTLKGYKLHSLDGSPKTTSFTPVSFTAGKSETVYLCGCKHIKNPPYCDGTHKAL